MMLLGALTALLIAALLAAATFVWLLAGGAPRRPRRSARPGIDAQAAFRRHPAGRDRHAELADPFALGQADTSPNLTQPAGPDDDPDFISALERLIRDRDEGESW